MIVDVTQLKNVLAYLQQINDSKLDTIDWIKNGQKCIVDSADLSNWNFVGLNNISFAETFLIPAASDVDPLV